MKPTKAQAMILAKLYADRRRNLIFYGWVGATEVYTLRVYPYNDTTVNRSTVHALIKRGWLYEDESWEWKISTQGYKVISEYLR